jgi:uncharacterized membrane protein
MKTDSNRCLLLAGLLLVFIAAIFWCAKKSDFFIDDVYSYGLSNSYYTPFLEDIPEQGNLTDIILTQEDLYQYITVSEGEGFRYDSVYFNQTQDVHPPLFYMFLHTICSFFPGKFSKWYGLSLNLLFFVLTLFLMDQIGKMLLEHRGTAILAMVLYGLSFHALSMVVLIRMYTMLTFFTVCLTYVWLKIYSGETCRKYYILLTLLIFLGLFTQYFFVFFAFFSSAVYCLHELWKKRWKNMILYAVFALAGVALFYFAYPAVMDHMFASKTVSGTTALENIMDYRGVLLSVYSFVMQTAARCKMMAWLLLFSFLLGIFRIGKIVRRLVACDSDREFIVLALAVSEGLAFLIAAMAAPMSSLRYVYNLFPVLVILIVYGLEKIWYGLLENKKKQSLHWLHLAAGCLILLSIWNAFTIIPDFVESMPAKNYQIIDSYASLPCIYITDNDSIPMTQDFFELMKFREVYITNDFLSSKTTDYTEQIDTENGMILYISLQDVEDADDFQKDTLKRIAENTKFQNSEQLFECGFSAAYHLY